MKLLVSYCLRHRWLNAAGAILIALLHRMPAARLAALAAEQSAVVPPGVVLRSALAAAASLGAVHTLAGATQFVASRNPIAGTVGTALAPASFTVTGAAIPAGSFRITAGTLPVGLAIAGLNAATNIVNGSSFTITGTPAAAGTSAIQVLAFERANAGGDRFPLTGSYQITFNISGAAATAPAISAQPASQTVTSGTSVTFTAAATGTPAPALQWRKDGVNVAGATNAALTLAAVQPIDAGAYTLVATNPAGSVVSAAAVLTVAVPASATPAFAAQPVAQTVAAGSTVVFSAVASGATSFQWRKDGTAIAGATRALLVLAAGEGDAGSYTVVATNAAGSTASAAATLALANAAPADLGRLVNLSILTPLAAGETMTMGAVLGGAGTNGTKALLARAAGPALAQLGVTGVLPDPQMILATGGVTVATNDNWAGAPALRSAFAQVGAFAYASDTSNDAALFQSTLAAGDYTVRVSDTTSAGGAVIAELYDATPGSAFTAATPRLVNVSVLKHIAAGTTLTAGFVVGGTTARTVLVRAIGPGLAQFGLGGFLADPQLALFAGAAKLSENDDWGGDPQLTIAGRGVGAFAITSTDSRDAMLLVTLAPGAYTAQVGPAGATAGGTAIVEVYEVP